ncbi:MAG: trypsin-like peptidase domain-containing protein [Candidatus Theseobacter exili]|nr:trypsin-like peptidase domain-containing protein [Candidatus Theseobacter exili]
MINTKKVLTVALSLAFINWGCVSITDNAATKFSLESLKLTAHTVTGYWLEEDLFNDDKQAWSGTASVIDKKDDMLLLVTNCHVLGLKSLSEADNATDSESDIKDYQLQVCFASGKKARVLAFGTHNNLDLAVLVVKADSLVEGEDYVMIHPSENSQVKVGDNVVAVGSPKGFVGTHTFGRISAVYNKTTDNSCRVFQTDAAINHGNSGGPLFIEQHGAFKWIGVNTWRIDNADNLGFAIDANELIDSKNWDMNVYPTNPKGAASALFKLFGMKAVVIK